MNISSIRRVKSTINIQVKKKQSKQNKTYNKKLKEILYWKNDKLNNISLFNDSLKNTLNKAHSSNKKLSDDSKR